MQEIYINADTADEALSIMIEFVSDVYEYLEIELPEDFDPEAELVTVIDAIRNKRNAL